MRYLLLSVFLVALPLSAAEDKHSLGILFGSGTIYTSDSRETSDVVARLGAYYQYRVNSRFALDLVGMDGGSACMITCSKDPYVTFSSYQLNAKASLPISSSWSAYGKLGVNSYGVKYTPGSITKYDDKKVSGTGAVFAAGLEFNTSAGFLFGFEFEDLPMHNTEARTFNAFAGFSF